MKNKICIVTGSRAEYGIFFPLLEVLKKTPSFALQIVVTGAHLAPEYGLTYREIERDGFHIDEKVRLPLDNDSQEGITKALGTGVIGFASVFKKLRPDSVVFIGDRFETFASAIAAFIARVPIIHIHGGELTEGAMDEAFRHSITKMSLIHFVSAEGYRRRVIQLGEDPCKVFNVGALAIDNIRKSEFIPKAELERLLKFNLDGKVVLVTFHPVTLEETTVRAQFNEVLSALNRFGDLKIIFTKPSSDLNGMVIARLIDGYVKRHKGQAIVFTSLGRIKYLSLLRYVDVMLGNSSSGIIEMPSFGKPTINIGDRQKGRIQARSVIQCRPLRADIVKALKKALSRGFSIASAKIKSPFGNGTAAKKIVSVLKRQIPRIKSVKKTFYDLR